VEKIAKHGENIKELKTIPQSDEGGIIPIILPKEEK